VRYNSQRTITAQTARIDLADESVYLQGNEAQTVRIDGSGAGAASPGASFRLINSSAHDAFCPDCKACPSMCPAGYVCKEATLIEFGGGKSYHCGLAETKPALTTELPAARPLPDGGVCDAGDAAICR
jgi:hypothetical protein